MSNAAGAVDLDAARESVGVLSNQAPPPPTTLTEADIQRVFGAALSDLPPPPERFNLYFRVDSDDLTVESQSALPAILQAVKARPFPDVTIIGHTDTTGSAENNFKLGLKRAMTVQALLLATGLDRLLIETESHGEAEPLVSTPDDTSEPRNRRVEIVIK